MGDPLYVNTEGVLGMARVHDAVAAGLGQLQNGAGLGQSVGPAGPATTHGLIAHGKQSVPHNIWRAYHQCRAADTPQVPQQQYGCKGIHALAVRLSKKTRENVHPDNK